MKISPVDAADEPWGSPCPSVVAFSSTRLSQAATRPLNCRVLRLFCGLLFASRVRGGPRMHCDPRRVRDRNEFGSFALRLRRAGVRVIWMCHISPSDTAVLLGHVSLHHTGGSDRRPPSCAGRQTGHLHSLQPLGRRSCLHRVSVVESNCKACAGCGSGVRFGNVIPLDVDRNRHSSSRVGCDDEQRECE